MGKQLVFRESIVLMLAIIASACGGAGPKAPANQPDHPLLRGLKPPPLNLPSPSPTATPPGPRRDEGPKTAPDFTTLRAGEAFQGLSKAVGQLRLMEGSGRIVGADNVPLAFNYALPPGLPPLPVGDFRGEVSILDRQTPSGPSRHVVVRADGSLALLYVSATGVQPIVIEISDGLRLKQRPTALEQVPSLQAVALEALGEGSPALQVPPKTAVKLSTRTGNLMLWLEFSEAYVSKNQRSAGTYHLKAWVVAAGR